MHYKWKWINVYHDYHDSCISNRDTKKILYCCITKRPRIVRFWRFYLSVYTTWAQTLSFTVTYPLDVVRRRTQMRGLLPQQFQYNSTLHAFSTILQHEGVRGMYKGMAPNLLKVAPSVAVAFVTYETAKHYLYFIGQSWPLGFVNIFPLISSNEYL